MRLPNKITPYKMSVLSKFPALLSALRESDLTPGELYSKTKRQMDGICEFVEALDCLYAIGAIEIEMSKGVIHYVG